VEVQPEDNRGRTGNRGKGGFMLFCVIVLFGILVLSLIFGNSTATADPLHWTSVFINFVCLFTIFPLAFIAGRYLRNAPPALGKTVRYYMVAGIILSSALITAGSYVESAHAWPLPWAFQGAYADYSANGSFYHGEPVTGTMSIFVLNADGQNAHLQFNFTFGIGDNSQTTSNSSWVSSTVWALPAGTDPEVARTYDTNVTLNGNTVQAVAYVYQPSISNNRTYVSTWFVSKSIQFPVEYDISIDNTTSVDMHLVRTNIPGLMP
jgi:hypothetical protein